MFKAKISSIKTLEDISLLELISPFGLITLVSLEIDSSLIVGSWVSLNFKSSDVVISKDKILSSIKNSFRAKVCKISRGEIITILGLTCAEIYFESMITTASFDELNISCGDEIFANIKSTSIFIDEILDA